MNRWMAAIAALCVGAAAFVAVQQGVIGQQNNFVIFRASSVHLMAGQDLYAPDPAHYTDLFKYSPTFALLFAPLAALPFAPALFVWSAINALALAGAVGAVLPPRRAAIAMAVASMEMFGAMQNAQSNALVAATIILAFAAFERHRTATGAAVAALGACIKVYPLAALACAVPRRQTVRATIWTAAALAVLVALPAFVIPGGWHGLLAQYQSWRAIEAIDAREGLVPLGQPAVGLDGGLMQVLRIWFGVRWPNWPTQAAGTVILLTPLVTRRRSWDDPGFRLAFLASVLVYALLFNHQAEAASFVVGMAGIGLWYASGNLSRARTVFVVAVIAAVSIPATGLFTRSWYHEVFIHYALKTVPVIAVWCVMEAELLLGKEVSVMSSRRNRALTEGDSSAASSHSRAIV